MNKQILPLIIGVVMLQSVAFAQGGYIQNMQNLSEQTDMQSANNELLEAQLKSITLQQKIKALGHDKSEAQLPSITQAAKRTETVSTQEDEAHSLLPQYNYGLKQIYGLGDNLTAVIRYGSNVIPVKQGDVLDGIWKVLIIDQSHIVLLNTQSKKQQKKYLYLTDTQRG